MCCASHTLILWIFLFCSTPTIDVEATFHRGFLSFLHWAFTHLQQMVDCIICFRNVAKRTDFHSIFISVSVYTRWGDDICILSSNIHTWQDMLTSTMDNSLAVFEIQMATTAPTYYRQSLRECLAGLGKVFCKTGLSRNCPRNIQIQYN